MKKNLSDLKEREAALDPKRSFIVQAPAGSGKTELLIRRFLTLLAAVNYPEQIIAITFTRKAAGEMHCRIMNALNKAKKEPPPASPYELETWRLAGAALKRDAERGWNLLETPARLKVQTTDSLCASLTRQMPILSGLGKNPAMTENAEELYREAARRTIVKVEKEGKDGEAVTEALRHLDNSFANLEQRIIAMLARRDQWLRHVSLKSMIDEDVLKKYLEQSIANLIKTNLCRVKSAFPGDILKEAIHYGSFAADNLLANGKENDITSLAMAEAAEEDLEKELAFWRGIRGLLLTADNKWRKPGGVNLRIGFPSHKSEENLAMKDGFKDLLARLETKEELGALLASLSDLPKGRYSESEWAILNDLMHLLPLADRELMKVFAEEGTVDFQTISSAALQSLGPDEDPTDLMLALDVKIQHILVDEYQDTSRTQLALLEALTGGWEQGDGRTLFIVGDPMQSIYLFREAEVGLFLKAKNEGMGTVKLEALTLRSNFRSQANIVNWVNSTLSTAFPGSEDDFLGSICYESFHPVVEAKAGNAVSASIFEERDDALEAVHVSKIIKSIRENNGHETIAVLARSRSHLAKIVENFKAEKIDFRTREIDPLYDRPVIQDLFALLRALMHPMDRIAWLAILRAPWCGLTLMDLHSLCVGDSGSSTWQLMHDEGRLSGLTDDGRERLLKLRSTLDSALPLWGRIPPRQLLEGLWIAIGGPACVDKNGIADSEAFFDMVDGMAQAGRIESLKKLESRIKALYANYSGKGDNPVEMLTIHKAKGLEYDHVIIPGFGKAPRSQEKILLRSMERGKDLLLAPIDGIEKGESRTIYAYLGKIQSEKEELEQRRLLYVAVTRAKKRLYLLGHVRADGDSLRPEKRSFLSAVEKIIDPEKVITKAERPMEDMEQGPPPMMLRRLPPDWKLPEAAPPLDVLIEETPQFKAEEMPEFEWAGEAIKHLGTVMHRYLCRITKDGLEQWGEKRPAGEKERMVSLLRELGLNRKEAGKMADEGIKALKKMLSHERGRWILSSHNGEGSEVPLTALMDNRIIHRIIDRTFVDKGVRWIIDYKISHHKGSDVDKFLKNEKERYRPQLEAYEKILTAGGEKRPIKKGLYYPMQKGWIEW
ncbi:MAG: UvrD-helicase domain-containing protein [Deltaproteobacteria bacterium]|nr:UvrD-helicase domain-containing protein [Deltaproteobacteria bacterium]